MAKGRAAVNAEYAGLRLACGLVNALPYCCAAALARAVGWTLVRVFAFKRRRTEGRIRSVFPEMSAREVRRVFRGKVYNTVIPRGVRLSEAPSHALPIHLYDPRSQGAQSYQKLAEEFLASAGERRKP